MYGHYESWATIIQLERELVATQAKHRMLWESGHYGQPSLITRLLRRLLRRGAVSPQVQAEPEALHACGATHVRAARRCVACGGSTVRGTHRAWRRTSRCVRRRGEAAPPRQHA